jgi:steroid delta-isomerase-like uncharacterized protein
MSDGFPDRERRFEMSKYRVLIVAAAACAVLATMVALDSSPVKADNNAVIEGWVAAWNSHDPDAVVALFTDDATYEDVPFGLVNHGAAEIHAFAQFFFTVVPDLHVDLVNSDLKGGHGTIEWVFSGTDVGLYNTGNTFSVRGATVIDVHGTKITRNSDYYDLATILRDLGLLPPGL